MALNINQELLPMKAHYYLFNAGTAPVVPFIPVFAKQLGYSATTVGLIYFILPITGMIAKPLFGWIADKFHKQKFFFIFFQLVVIVAFLIILLIPAIPSRVEFHCHEGEKLFQHCPPDITKIGECSRESVFKHPNETFTCTLQCQRTQEFSAICDKWNVPGLCESKDQYIEMTSTIAHKSVSEFDKCFNFFMHNTTIDEHETTLFCPSNQNKTAHTHTPTLKMNCTVKCNDASVTELISGESDDGAQSTYQFWFFLFMLIASWVGMAVVVSLGDAICFGLLGDKPQRYGHQRLWGSVGWGSLSIVSGILIDKFSTGATKNYAVGFYIMAIMIIIDMLVSSKIKHSQTKHSSDIFGDIIEIVKSLRIIVFMLWCIAVGLGTAMIWNFLFWHLEEISRGQGCEYDSTMKTLQGLMMGIQCFGGELPFFFLSGKILKKIGHVNAMSLVLFTFACRFFFYSILENPWYALPIELMSGVTFGIFYATMASYASIVAPSGTEATMQGLVGAVFEGIGVSFGSWLGGSLMSQHGGSVTFRYFAIAAFLAFLAHIIIQWLMDKFLGPYGKKSHSEENKNGISGEHLDVKDTNHVNESDDDGFKEVDLARQ